MKMQCPSTSVTTLWVTSVKALVCWLELASSTRSETLNGEFNLKKLLWHSKTNWISTSSMILAFHNQKNQIIKVK